MELYHNANIPDVDSFSTHSDGTKRQQQRKGDGDGKDADNCYKSTLSVGSVLYKLIPRGTHPWTHTDMQCSRRQDETAWDLIYDIIFLDTVTTRHFSQFQQIWPPRWSRSSPFRGWWAASRSFMGQMCDKTHDQMNNWRWDNPRAFGDHVDRSNLQKTSSGMVKRTSGCSLWYSSYDPRVKIEPPSCRQFKPGHLLVVRPPIWDEIIEEDDDDNNRADPGVPCGGRSHPGNATYNDDGQVEEDM